MTLSARCKLMFGFFILILFSTGSASGQGKDQHRLPDVSGTWEGNLGGGVYSQIYLKRISDSVYVGIHHLNSVRPGEQLHFETDPSLQWNMNLLFWGSFDGSQMIFTPVDTTLTPPKNVEFNGGYYHFTGEILDQLYDERNGMLPYQAKRISRTIPAPFDHLLLQPTDLQLTIGSVAPPIDRGTGAINITINNKSAYHYRGLEVELVALEKDRYGNEHATGSLQMSKTYEVDRATHGDFPMAFERGLFSESHDSVHFRFRLVCATVVLDEKQVWFATNELFMTAGSKPVAKPVSQQLVGVYKLPPAGRTGKLAYFFPNAWVEFHSQGVGICRGGASGTKPKPRLFFWRMDADSLRLFESPDKSTAFGLKEQGGGWKITYQVSGKTVELGLQKESNDPTLHYKPFLARGAKGNWERVAFFTLGALHENAGTFYDIHMTAESRGELIQYTNPNDIDSIYFMRYMDIPNEIHPAFSMNDHYYSCDWLGYDSHANIDFYTADDLIIMNQFGVRTFYLVPAGPTRWADPEVLHREYNGSHLRQIPHYATHWATCSNCYGKGTVDLGTKQVYDYTDGMGQSHYKQEVSTGDCGVCHGRGGYFVRDSDNQRVE